MLLPKFAPKGDRVRVLDFDIENRPLSYLGMDYTTAEITGIAAKFIGERGKVSCWLLGRESAQEMLEGFLEMYNAADVVTGHFIRNHDLPLIQGSLARWAMPLLGDKLTSCTKNDLLGLKGISKSQENLSQLFGVAAPKIHMNAALWDVANFQGGLVSSEALALTEERVVGDIKQHIQLRAELIRRNLLSTPKVWSPGGSPVAGYTP